MTLDEENEQGTEEKSSTLRSKLVHGASLVETDLRSSWKEAQRNKCNSFLGFAACMFAVAVVVVIHTGYKYTPIFFLAMAEASVGEVDVVIRPGGWTDAAFLNYSRIRDEMGPEQQFNFSAPRYSPSAYIYRHRTCNRTALDPMDSDAAYTGPPGPEAGSCRGRQERASSTTESCLSVFCGPPFHTSLLVIDTELERRMGWGRRWALPAVPDGGVFLLREYAVRLGLWPGDWVTLRVDMDTYLGAVAAAAGITGGIGPAGTVLLPLQVSALIDEPQGKFRSDDDSVALVERGPFFRAVARRLHPARPDLRAAAAAADPAERAETVGFNVPPDRLEAYMDNSYARVEARIQPFVSRVVARLGFEDVSADMVVLRELRKLQLFSVFLDLIISVVLVVVGALLMLLVHALLVVSVEARGFELAVLRLLGVGRPGIARILVAQAVSMSIPAFVLGLAAGKVCSDALLRTLGDIIGTQISPRMQVSTLGWAAAMGLVVPVFAGALPVRAAVAGSLSEALNLRRSKVTAVKVTVERNRAGRPPAGLTTAGVVLVTLGTAIYYLFPKALLDSDLSLLLSVLFGLLLGMLYGLTLLSLNLERPLEILFARTCLWWNGSAARALMLKNLIAHRVRNRKTTIMYALSLGFIIFIVVTVTLQLVTFQFAEQQRKGTVLRLQCPMYDTLGPALAAIDELKSDPSESGILDTAYVTFPLRDVLRLRATRLATLGRVFQADQMVYGVSPNFFRVVLPGFLAVAEWPSGAGAGGPDLDEALYSARGSQSVILGSLYRSTMALTTESTFLLELLPPVPPGTPTDGQLPVKQFRLRPLAFLDGLAGLTMSRYPEKSSQDALVSIPTLLRLAAAAGVDSLSWRPEEVPIRWVMFRPVNDSDAALALAKRRIMGVAGISGSCRVQDLRDNIKVLSVALDAMDLLGSGTTSIALVISLASLSSSMYANIQEQSKEMGILRALGARRPYLVRVLVLEAVTLVVCASCMGLLIGTVVAFTVTAQRSLFTQLPLPFDFPWPVMEWLLPSALLSALAAALLPAAGLLRQRISRLLRALF